MFGFFFLEEILGSLGEAWEACISKFRRLSWGDSEEGGRWDRVNSAGDLEEGYEGGGRAVSSARSLELKSFSKESSDVISMS